MDSDDAGDVSCLAMSINTSDTLKNCAQIESNLTSLNLSLLEQANSADYGSGTVYRTVWHGVACYNLLIRVLLTLLSLLCHSLQTSYLAMTLVVKPSFCTEDRVSAIWF